MRRGKCERGSLTPWFILMVLASVVLIGFVVDGGGKVQTMTRAQHVAASAARAATKSLDSVTITAGRPHIGHPGAERIAAQYIAAHGMTGSASVQEGRITVTVTEVYETRFLGIIGIDRISVTGTASARLIDGPLPEQTASSASAWVHAP